MEKGVRVWSDNRETKVPPFPNPELQVPNERLIAATQVASGNGHTKGFRNLYKPFFGGYKPLKGLVTPKGFSMLLEISAQP